MANMTEKEALYYLTVERLPFCDMDNLLEAQKIALSALKREVLRKKHVKYNFDDSLGYTHAYYTGYEQRKREQETALARLVASLKQLPTLEVTSSNNQGKKTKRYVDEDALKLAMNRYITQGRGVNEHCVNIKKAV